jgi:hypothetical protein
MAYSIIDHQVAYNGFPQTGSSGIVPVVSNAKIASTTSLGVVRVGSGLSISTTGLLSITNNSNSFINVTLVGINYTASATDYYVGATVKDITITLPAGLVGKVYVIKNQTAGNITVTGTGGQTLDSELIKTVGTKSSIICVFDDTQWNIIQ